MPRIAEYLYKKLGRYKEIFYYSPTKNPATGREKTYERKLKNVERFMKKTEPNQREAPECFPLYIVDYPHKDDANG